MDRPIHIELVTEEQKIYCLESVEKDSFQIDAKMASRLFTTCIYSDELDQIFNQIDCKERLFYEVDEPIFKSKGANSTYFGYFKAQDVKENMYVLKKYSIDPELIVENVKFYKDYLFSVYLKHKNIFSPLKVYSKPEYAILYVYPEGGNLAKLHDVRTNGYKGNRQSQKGEIIEPNHLDYYEILEIIKFILKGVKNCHHFGVIIKNLCMENIVFTKREFISSLKIMDFSQCIITDYQDDFSDKIKLSEIQAINSIEKNLIKNTDMAHIDPKKIDHSTLKYKPPEYMLGKSFTQKIDIWAVGIILHYLVMDMHLFEVIFERSVKEITISDIKSLFESMTDQINFSAPIYSHIPDSLKNLMKMMLDINPETRPTAFKLLNIIKSMEQKVYPVSVDEKSNFYAG